MSSLEKRKEGMGPGEYEQKAVEAGFVRVCGCDEADAANNGSTYSQPS